MLRRVALFFVVALMWLLQPFFRVMNLARSALRTLYFELNFRPRPDDIYIATSAKAGTTWMQMILFQLKTGGRGEFDHILQVSPFLEDFVENGRLEHLEGLSSPRLFKTHLPYDNLRPPRESRCIYVSRNVMDVCFSYHHHVVRGRKFDVNFNHFFQHFLHSGDWFRHTESWMRHRHDENVLWIRYEDLKRDLEGGIRKIAAFCNIPIEEERMGEILHKCSFAYMKEHDAKFDHLLGFYGKEFPKGFVRKGTVGADRDRLTPQQAAALNERLTALKQKLNLADEELQA